VRARERGRGGGRMDEAEKKVENIYARDKKNVWRTRSNTFLITSKRG